MSKVPGISTSSVLQIQKWPSMSKAIFPNRVKILNDVLKS